MTKFEVIRTSEYYGGKPCEEAEEEERVKVDVRSTSDPPYWWYSEGTNHRVVNGCICRDMGLEKVWVVNINTLDDLKQFIQKYGKVVISEFGGNWRIEIYDDWRE